MHRGLHDVGIFRRDAVGGHGMSPHVDFVAVDEAFDDRHTRAGSDQRHRRDIPIEMPAKY
jgi:hypothetical protein